MEPHLAAYQVGIPAGSKPPDGTEMQGEPMALLIAFVAAGGVWRASQSLTGPAAGFFLLVGVATAVLLPFLLLIDPFNEVGGIEA